ncbi:hypothetical protein [Protofrankia symbiont of Coriaria ruscifolia]|uniref:hypothetical protein n=1 Tax=Protofrankia symbiont of Coriaria ruscifolia TaxID=1306542 RepID=UPI001041A72A|nr:hypothetical protein [Protofrankia symbiont of Coriaria ruscifolia]
MGVVEDLCRAWARWHASPDTHGGHPSRVAAGTVHDPAARTSHEIDFAVFGHHDSERETLLALGKAKWNETMGISHLQRLDHIRSLLHTRTTRTTSGGVPRLLCFSGAGFTPNSTMPPLTTAPSNSSTCNSFTTGIAASPPPQAVTSKIVRFEHGELGPFLFRLPSHRPRCPAEFIGPARVSGTRKQAAQ